MSPTDAATGHVKPERRTSAIVSATRAHAQPRRALLLLANVAGAGMGRPRRQAHHAQLLRLSL
jgi:hypothetical protein